MKKFATFAIVMLLTLSLLGCSAKASASDPEKKAELPKPNAPAATALFELPKQEVSQEKGSTYLNGTFVGYADAEPTSKGFAFAVVTIKNDKMTDVKLAEVTEFGQLKDYATYAKKDAGTANSEMAKRFLEKNSVDVQDYAGTTSSSKKYKQAVGRALEKALVNKAGPKLFDGSFMAVSSREDKGYAIAYVTIKEDKITNVVLQEVQPFGDDKNYMIFKDYANYPKKEAGEANAEMSKRFIAKNSTEVEDFAGITSSSKKYKEATAMALEMALK